MDIKTGGGFVAKITVWTKQNEKVLDQLNQDGRYLAKREYIQSDLHEYADLVLESYDWLAGKLSKFIERPEDVTYPIWVSDKREATMLASDGTVILELEVESELVIFIDINKWGSILNYSYIPIDEIDLKNHRDKLKAYGVNSDAKAYMSEFYPQIKRDIINSWDRLFDDKISLGKGEKYGLIWEVKGEWIRQVIE